MVVEMERETNRRAPCGAVRLATVSTAPPPFTAGPNASSPVWARLTEDDLRVLHDCLVVLVAREQGSQFLAAFSAVTNESFGLTEVESGVLLSALGSPWEELQTAVRGQSAEKVQFVERLSRTFGPLIRRYIDGWLRPYDWHSTRFQLIPAGDNVFLFSYFFERVDGETFDLTMDVGSLARFLSRLLNNSLVMWKGRGLSDDDKTALQEALEATDDGLEVGPAR
jgi:hypothetical protein